MKNPELKSEEYRLGWVSKKVDRLIKSAMGRFNWGCAERNPNTLYNPDPDVKKKERLIDPCQKQK